MTDRAKIANVRSIVEQKQSKGQRRAAKQGRDMVPVGRVSTSSGDGDLRVAPNSVTLADQHAAEMANMEEARLFTDRELELLGVVHPRLKSRPLVDSMRQLRTKLYTLNPTENFSVMVCPVVPEGGGSFVATNLAATIAFDKAKTSLLVDANLNGVIMPRLLKLIGREHALGVSDYLENPSVGIENIVSPSGIPRMRCVPIGSQPENSAEHFTSARYQQMMHDIKVRYDNRYVVVDGPALSSSTDARILSDLCDYTVLVVPYGKVTPGTLDAWVDEIDEQKLAGIVINDQPSN